LFGGQAEDELGASQVTMPGTPVKN
jgi:hypothetical protein